MKFASLLCAALLITPALAEEPAAKSVDLKAAQAIELVTAGELSECNVLPWRCHVYSTRRHRTNEQSKYRAAWFPRPLILSVT